MDTQHPVFDDHYLKVYLGADPFFQSRCVNTAGNYTANSTYQANLNTIFSQLTSQTDFNYGFYNLSAGQNSNRVNAIALCRGDRNQNDCNTCLNETISQLGQQCPLYKEVVGCRAASAGPLRKYAADNSTVGLFQRVYALVQFSPDLAEQQCGDCLSVAKNGIGSCCLGRRGCRILRPSCFLRYESDQFYQTPIPLPSTPPPATPPPPPPPPLLLEVI
ncbi:Detected protein of confused Function [Hibiscus syriacus]|uniref:Detected protein of confused Function n=1 Tax=Hibiscus syriacus TaxID=106335 RepID=A0A6A3BDK6_HIBSY|nr:Detected protein of confused Function [Hibiscus syriacus]